MPAITAATHRGKTFSLQKRVLAQAPTCRIAQKHKNDYTMKKTYTSPQTEIIELDTSHLIAVSIPAPPVVNKEDWANEYDASEYRSDWENIWADM